MALVRVLSKIDADGKVTIPGNVLRATGMKRGETVEMKVTGVSEKHILLSSRRYPAPKRIAEKRPGTSIPAG